MSVRQLLQARGLEPRKGMGQNFLTDPHILARIVAAAEVEADDQILEVGPGLGSLTRALAEKARRVVAVELDSQLIAILRETLADLPNVELVAADILTVDVGKIMAGELRPGGDGPAASYKVVANLPYNITSAALRYLLESKPAPELLVVMVQKEVAQRIIASPGEMSLLAVSVQFYGKPRIVAYIPAGAFYPRPKVDSAILRIETDLRGLEVGEGRGAIELRPYFFALVRAGFGQRRKQLRNALAQGLGLPAATVERTMQSCRIDPKRRAESLSLAEWAALWRAFSAILLDGIHPRPMGADSK